MQGNQPEGPYGRGTAYFLWLACAFGFCGVHRFYLGRHGTGILYFLTFGLLGVGQFVDLLRMPTLVAEENARFRALTGHGRQPLLPAKEPEHIEVVLAKAAAQHGGRVTLAQAVVATGKPFKEVEKALDEMLAAGHVGIDNDEQSGVVVYTFS